LFFFLKFLFFSAPVTVNAQTALKYIEKSTQTTSHVVVGVETSEPEEESARAPMELCIVLDRSGSMRGDRLEFSKTAIKNIVEDLDVNDKLHFITFDNGVQTVFLDGDLARKPILLKQIADVRTGGSTNISGALTHAADAALKLEGNGMFFKSRKNRPLPGNGEGTVNCGECKAKNFAGYKFCQSCGKPPVASTEESSKQLAKRIFLFSDGQANQGLRNRADLACLAEEICGAGASITCFGLGKDFNEDVLTDISKNGQGAFFFIETSKRIPEIVADALGGVKALVGTKAKITLEADDKVCRFVKIYDHKNNVAELRDLRYKNLVQAVVEFEMLPLTETGPVDFMTFKLEYNDAKTGDLVKIEGKLTHNVTDDKNKVKFDNDAQSIVLALQASEMDKEILQKIDSGRREEAIAKKKKQVQLMEQAATMAPSNMNAQVMWQASQRNCEYMEREKDVRVVRKKAQYEGYLRRKNSTSSIAQLSGMNYSDSDEGEAPKSRSRTPSPTKRMSGRKPAQEAPSLPPAPQQRSFVDSVSSFFGMSSKNDNNEK